MRPQPIALTARAPRTTHATVLVDTGTTRLASVRVRSRLLESGLGISVLRRPGQRVRDDGAIAIEVTDRGRFERLSVAIVRVTEERRLIDREVERAPHRVARPGRRDLALVGAAGC